MRTRRTQLSAAGLITTFEPITDWKIQARAMIPCLKFPENIPDNLGRNLGALTNAFWNPRNAPENSPEKFSGPRRFRHF